MGLLNSLDIVVIVAYLVGITTVAIRFYQKNTEMNEYLLGSRGMKWFPVALSILAADTSALTYLGFPAWSFRHDLKYNQMIFPYLIAVPIVIWIFLPIYSKGNLYTAYQYLGLRFDLRVRLVTSLLFLVIRGAHVAVIIYAPALVMAELMGVPLKFSILMMGLLTAVYTAMGGIKSVIWTDAIQVGMVCLGFTVVAVAALTHISGGVPCVWSTGLAHGKFELFDFSLNLDKVDNFWALMIGSTVLAVQAMSTDQAVLQKYFTTKSKMETTKSLVFYGAVNIPMVCFLSLLGILLFVVYEQHPSLKASLQNPDVVVPHFAAKMLPHGLAGLVVASIFAGSMSTVSASLNSLATSSVVDFYKELIQKHGSDAHYTRASRWATLLWGVLATAGAFYAHRLGALVTAFAKVNSLIGGIILGIFVLGALSRRATGPGVILGALVSLGIVIYVSLYTPVTLYWYCIIGGLTTVVTGWLFSLLFPQGVPESE
jgi:SSS family solute:Na+ symporter